MSVNTRPMTADEFLMMPDDGMLHELIRGEVTTMSLPGGRHGKIPQNRRVIGNFVEKHGLGKTYAAETGFLIERSPTRFAVPTCPSSAGSGLSKSPTPISMSPSPRTLPSRSSPRGPARRSCREGRDLAVDGRPDGMGRQSQESDRWSIHAGRRTDTEGGRHARGRRDPPRIHMRGQDFFE